MSLSGSILVALFCMAIVFTVLGLLSIIIRLFSIIIRVIERSNDKSTEDA